MLCRPSSSCEYTSSLAASVFRPLSGSWSQTSPVRSVCSTRPSGRTARSMGSPGVWSIGTFWNCESGGAWADAADGMAHTARAPARAASARALRTCGPPWGLQGSVGHAVEVGEALLGRLERVERGVAEARVVLDDEVADAAAGGSEDRREVDRALADDLDGAILRRVLDVEELDPVAVLLDQIERIDTGVRGPVQVKLEE